MVYYNMQFLLDSPGWFWVGYSLNTVYLQFYNSFSSEQVMCSIDSTMILGSSLGESRHRDLIIWAWYWHSILPVNSFLNTAICMAPMGVRGSWASGSGNVINGAMSLSRGGPDTDSSGSDPSGSSGFLCETWDPVVVSSSSAVPSGSGACSPHLSRCAVVAWAAGGSLRSVASSEGVRDATGTLSGESKAGISKTSSSLNFIRWAMHLWRS